MRYDLINRADLPTVRIEIPKRLDDETIGIVEGLVKAFKAVIDSAPAVDAEPVRHGRWFIKVNAIDRTFTCNKCRKWIIPTTNALMNYCPNCGAKMDAEVEG